ncbi:UDP-4-amino-4,6-dideoxy-N-acetyl-beta-L-altrosamine transaminase [Zavarzinella formosa]|uniref:UDP-4-amino-4, 6-dideoxy-N-acetyl-beta-L-altrosamine transaminase n=1 Tax=Zavarzinella formosa TaxID=360055 RepID=UPI000315B5CD|nr:UDP-4-amino-4,6-dideoxy-N-acetyl-beta-L-altrosamine transaminase [Zavarzinella formosa]
MASPIPYGRQWIDDDDIAAVVECLRGDWLTQGPAVERFEQSLRDATGARHAVAVASGTAALHLAALAAGVGPGDIGLTSAITFTASANCVAYCGGDPHFIGIDPATGLMDISLLEARVRELANKGTPPKVIVPVDLAGQPADLPAVRRIADTVGALVIEDAAHSLGARYTHNNTTFRAGSCEHTDFAILSFHPVKHVTTAEGGAVLTNNPELATKLRDLRTHGIHRDPKRLTRPDEGPWYYEQASLGFHYRLSDMQCALGISQMKKLEAFVVRRNEIAARYDDAFAKAPFAGKIVPLKKTEHLNRNAYHLYVIRLMRQPGETLDAVAARRKALFLNLRERGIIPQVHYIPVPMQPYYRDKLGRLDDGSREYYASCLSIPMYPKMTDGDVARTIDTLAECINAGDNR